jgi:hypothetical protein
LQQRAGYVARRKDVSEKWTTSLDDNADRLKNLARFYHSHGLFVIATLLGAATAAIEEEATKVRATQRREKDDDVRRIS